MKKEILMKCNWTIRKADVWRIWKLIKDNLDLNICLIDIVEKIKNWELESMASFVMNQNNDFVVYETHNIVPNIFRDELAKKIAWISTTCTFVANYIALWGDSSAPLHTDTNLWSETIRWTITNKYTADNVAYLDKFFSSAEVSGNTYLEAWIFCDGTASANTWFLLSKINMNETIWPNEVLTINCSIAINSAT